MNGVTPDAFGRSTSAPCASSARTTSLSKVCAARSSGVAPVVSRSSLKRLSRPPRLGSLKASCAFGFTPACEQRLDERQRLRRSVSGAAVLSAAHRHRHVERRAAPPVPGVRVGAALEQVAGDVGIPVVERHDHRRHAVGVGPILVGAGLDHGLHAPEASRARGVQERRQTAGRPILHARLVADLRSASRWRARAPSGRPPSTPGTPPCPRDPAPPPTSRPTDRGSARARLTSAPWRTSSFATATLPVRAASINGVCPSSLVTLASAPASRSIPTSSTLATLTASASGLAP